MPSDLIERLRVTLAETMAAAPEGRMLLSQLGIALRLRLPDFSPREYGFESLRVLAETFPDVGRLARGTRPQEWWFIRDGASTDLTTRAEPQVPQRHVSPPHGDRLRREWWDAFVARDGEARATWLDLATLQLTADAALIGAEPERYIAIPTFDLRRFCGAWVLQLAQPWAADAALTLTGAGWKEAFESLLTAHGAIEAYKRARTHEVVVHALAWARDHGIDETVLLEPRRRPRQEQGRRPRGELRATLHRLLDVMTDDELTQLSWPAHLLMRYLPLPPES